MTADRTAALEAAQRRMGNWTFDDIAEAVLRNDDISISLTEAILATLDQVRALLSAAKEAAQEITLKATPGNDIPELGVQKEITPSVNEVRAVSVALRNATSTAISPGTLKRMAREAIRAFRAAEQGAAKVCPEVDRREEDRMREALRIAREDLFSWCGEGSGSQPTLDLIDAALLPSEGTKT